MIHSRPKSSLLLLLLLTWAPSIWTAPAPFTGSGPDSTIAPETADHRLLYTIKRDRLQRALREKSAAGLDGVMPEDMAALLSEAEEAAAAGDYLLALICLEEVVNFYDSLPAADDARRITASDWRFELLSGHDLWQQRFAISLTDQDSVIRESRGNPYVGVRGSFSGRDGRGSILRASGEGKIGGEYLFGSAHGYYEAPVGRHLALTIQDRLEATHYNEEESLRYWHNQFRTRLSWNWFAGHTLAAEQERLWRQYLKPGDLFADHNQQQWSVRMQGLVPALLRYEARYDRRDRAYPGNRAQDYQEDLLSLSWLPAGLHTFFFKGWLQSRARRYGAGYIDSLFTNDFNEWYAQGTLSWNPSPAWLLEVAANWNDRTYAWESTSSPSFQDVLLEPSVQYMINGHISLKAGYRYHRRQHASEDDGSSVAVEDYYAHAPVLGLDITWKDFLLNLQEIYELRRYPNAPQGESTFYADHDIHSLLLFISWNLSAHWSVNVMAHIDQDLARNEQGSDARSNILNAELAYRF